MRAPSIPEFSPRTPSIPRPRARIRRDWSTFLTRVGRWRKRARWVQAKLKAVPKAISALVMAAAILTVFSATNLVYQMLRKPTEMFSLP